MALSWTIIDGPKAQGNKYVTVAEATGDSTYPTNGEAVTANDLKLSNIEYFESINVSAVAGTVNIAEATFDRTNKKIKFFDETPAEIANGTDLSEVKVVAKAVGV